MKPPEAGHFSESSNKDFTLSLVTTRREFLGLENAWRELSEKCHCSNLFTSFDWVLTWWGCLGSDKQLMVFVLRLKDRIIGIAPLMKIRRSFCKLPYREIYLISATEDPFSPRAFAGTLDFLIPDEFPGEYECFVRYLLTSFRGWNYVKLHPLPEKSRAPAIFRKVAGEQNRELSIVKVFENACISTNEPWEEYYARRSTVFQKNTARRYRNLRARHRAEFVEYRAPEEMDRAITDILAIEKKSWKWKEGVRINDPRSHDFYFSLARKFAEKNMTRIWVLRIDGRPVAYDFNIQINKCIKALKSSYDEDFAALSPGILLNYTEYRQFLQEDIHHIDLLWGNLRFKQRWANVLEPHYGVYLRRNDPYTRMIDIFTNSPVMQRLSRGYRRIRRRFVARLKGLTSWAP